MITVTIEEDGTETIEVNVTAISDDATKGEFKVCSLISTHLQNLQMIMKGVEQLENAELRTCNTCKHEDDHVCTRFGSEIPAEFYLAVDECTYWEKV